MIKAPLPQDAPLGVYVHIPFCAHICPYCDFTTYAGKQDVIGRYVDALELDIARWGDTVGNRPVSTVFFGGGTPSLLSGEHMQRAMTAVRHAFALLPEAEVTMECNPNGLQPALLEAYREAGVNRLSIGAQTLDRRGLRTLGRQHEAADVLRSLADARAAGFDNVSLDFIFGWPNQRLETWRNDLEQVLALPDPPAHLSLYSLIVEPGTPFADAAARGILAMPDDDATADMYELAMRVLADAGWHHYEVANWSRDVDGYSRHNAIYWQHGDYLGLGAGAHATIGSQRTMNHLLPERWCDAVESGASTASNVEAIGEKTSMSETMLLGLRLREGGVSASAFRTRHGVGLDEVFPAQLARFTDLGLMERLPDGVRLTDRGLLLANEVIAEFL